MNKKTEQTAMTILHILDLSGERPSKVLTEVFHHLTSGELISFMESFAIRVALGNAQYYLQLGKANHDKKTNKE